MFQGPSILGIYIRFRGCKLADAYTLPETNLAPENGWLEDFLVSFWGKRPIFRCEMAVSFREAINLLRSYRSVNHLT